MPLDKCPFKVYYKVDMGKRSDTNEERNAELIADYQKKNDKGEYEFTTSQLVGKYDISTSRIYEILEKYNITKRSE